MYKHIKYVCKKNKDEDFKELARLMNEKDKQMKEKDFYKDAILILIALKVNLDT